MSRNEPAFEDHRQCDSLSAAVAAQVVLSPGSFRVRHYRAGNFIWMADESPTRVFVVLSGRVDVTMVARNGVVTLVRILEAGQMAGELCFCKYQGETLGTQGTAITKCEIGEASYAEFQKAIRQNAALTARMLESLCGRVAAAEQRATLLSIRSARQRLGKLLVHLAESKEGRRMLTVSHQELASLACLTRPHVTVLMTGFRESGFVSYQRGVALTVNLKMLRRWLGE